MIKEFQLQDASKLADMFNASDEGWPGGFTHGMPITPEVVLEYKKKEECISTLVGWDGDRIVGIAELVEFWRDTNVLYVGFLNVIPSHHGKGYGRDLLKGCIQKSTELKCKRLDLHTWAGNMKAVPLYKKTGFFWVPKTLVHMKNFLPLILNMEASKPYFEKHDWYKTFTRELDVTEDDYKGVYPHTWEEDGDKLSIIIDAESGGVIAFENSEVALSQKVDDAFIGRPVTITWTVKGKTEAPLTVNMVSRGEKGISFDARESVMMEGKEERIITREAFIDFDAEIRKEEEPPLLITTDVVVNSIPITLVSGLRVKYPVAVSTYPEYLFLPRGEQEICVVLKNNQKERVTSVITCQNTGESHNFSIDPGFTEGILFSVTVEKDGELQFSLNDSPPVYIIPVRVSDGANVMQKGRDIIMENTHTRIVVSLLGGETSIYDKSTGEFWANEISDDLGPPFWPSELFKTVYTVRMETCSGKVIAEFAAESKKYNARLIRRIEMDSTPLIKVQHRLIPQKKVSLHFGGETPMKGGLLTLPLKEGIVSEFTMDDVFPLEDGDLPRNPSDYGEQWVCYEREGSALGLIWDTCTEMEVKGWTMLNIIMDGEELKPFYLYAGRGTWKDVRAAWSRINNKEKDISESEEPKRIWEVNPSVILTVDDAITPDLTLLSYRGRPLEGTINGESFHIKKGSPFTFNPVWSHLELGVTTNYVHIKTDLFHKDIPISVVRTGRKGDITIREDDIIEVDNGLYTMKVAPQFYGSVIFLGREVNHLFTSYPEISQLSWFRPWWGGIHPMVYKERKHSPGRMHKETFTYTLPEIERQGILWKGVTVTSDLQEIKGIRLETSYLTCAFSNLLVIENSLTNCTSAPFNLYTRVMVYLQPEGSLRDSTLYYYQGDLQERRRTQYGGNTLCKDWAAVKGGKTVLALIGDSLAVSDMEKNGAHFCTIKKETIPPDSTVTSVCYLVITHSLEEAQKYTILRGVPWV
jgi:GNAT superfamily N-acetyltransferase